MSASAAVQSKPLALEVHQLLRELDPSRWRMELEAALRERASQLHTTLRTTLAQAQVGTVVADEPALDSLRGSPQLSAHLHDIATLLEDIPSAELPGEQLRDRWQQLRSRLQQAYDALREALRDHQVHVPVVRPTNYTRSLVHVGLASSCVLLAEVLSEPLIWVLPLAAALMAWSMEAARHFHPGARKFLLWVFKDIAHPHERHRVNSSTWFTTGLALLALLLAPKLAAVAVAVLGFADPAAGLVGRRFGRTKLIKQRSLEGSSAFVVVGMLVGLAVLSLFHADMAWGSRLAVAFGAALCGAIAELFSSGNLDDNLAVPLGAGFGGWLVLLLLGG